MVAQIGGAASLSRDQKNPKTEKIPIRNTVAIGTGNRDIKLRRKAVSRTRRRSAGTPKWTRNPTLGTKCAFNKFVK
jgi:hypothetical protein